MRLQTKRTIMLLGLLVFVAAFASFAPAGAQGGPQLDFTPVAQVYLPLVESHSSLDSRRPTSTPTMTLTSTFTRTPTPTTTAYPAPPTLNIPANGAVLAQPVGPNEWLFQWNARMGPCYSVFNAHGPNSYPINAFVSWEDSSPLPYSYHYTRTEPFPASAIGLWTWQVTVVCPLGSAQSATHTFYLRDDTPTPTSTLMVTPPTSTPTPTSTAYPAPPVLIAPSSGAVLPQPIGSNEWLFQWNARTGPCYSSFSATGPNGHAISAFVHWENSSPGPYSYHYARTVPFPAEAFGLWTWRVTVICPLGSAQSETHTFYLQGDALTPTPTPTCSVDW